MHEREQLIAKPRKVAIGPFRTRLERSLQDWIQAANLVGPSSGIFSSHRFSGNMLGRSMAVAKGMGALKEESVLRIVRFTHRFTRA